MHIFSKQQSSKHGQRETMERKVLPSMCKQQTTDAVHTAKVFKYSFKHLSVFHFSLEVAFKSLCKCMAYYQDKCFSLDVFARKIQVRHADNSFLNSGLNLDIVLCFIGGSDV